MGTHIGTLPYTLCHLDLQRGGLRGRAVVQPPGFFLLVIAARRNVPDCSTVTRARDFRDFHFGRAEVRAEQVRTCLAGTFALRAISSPRQQPGAIPFEVPAGCAVVLAMSQACPIRPHRDRIGGGLRKRAGLVNGGTQPGPFPGNGRLCQLALPVKSSPLYDQQLVNYGRVIYWIAARVAARTRRPSSRNADRTE
jgi:hypothetical protein